MWDKAKTSVAWGSSVVGISVAPGWVKVNEYFLPQVVNGKQVLCIAPAEPASETVTHLALDTAGCVSSIAYGNLGADPFTHVA